MNGRERFPWEKTAYYQPRLKIPEPFSKQIFYRKKNHDSLFYMFLFSNHDFFIVKLMIFFTIFFTGEVLKI